MKNSSLASAAIFTHQAEWPAQGIEKTVPPYFHAGTLHPVFFGGRKRESKQVDRSGNQAAPHPQSKHGALEEARRRVAGGGQPLANLICEPMGYRIRLHQRSNLVRQLS